VANPMNSVDVRKNLAEALRLDLVGPSENLGDPAEVLPQAPSRWYLTGFLVPLGAEPSQRADEASTEDLDQAGEGGGLDDDVTPDPPAARQRYLPSSIGVSLLVPGDARQLKVVASWGDYHRRSELPEEWARTRADHRSAGGLGESCSGLSKRRSGTAVQSRRGWCAGH
jgi:hypothetical protein